MNHTETDLHVLATRVEKLEAQNRRWKLIGSLTALFAASFLLTGAKPADRIDPPVIRASAVEAQEFILKDMDGHVYARLSLGRDFAAMSPNGLRITPNQNTPNFMTNRPAPNQATLQFYDERGDVLWTAPTSPTMIPVR